MPFLILILAWTLFNSNEASAHSHVTLQVGLSDVAPISFIKDGKISGINYDITKQIEKNSGLKFNYTLYPHARIKKVLETPGPDFVLVFKGVCSKYSNHYEMSKDLYPMQIQMHLNKSIDPVKTDIRIARIRGTCVDLSTAHVKRELILDVDDLNQAINMLKVKRIDGVCGTDLVIAHHLKAHPEIKEQLYVYKTQLKDDRLESVMCMKKNLSDIVKKKLHKATENLKIPLYDKY